MNNFILPTYTRDGQYVDIVNDNLYPKFIGGVTDRFCKYTEIDKTFDFTNFDIPPVRVVDNVAKPAKTFIVTHNFARYVFRCEHMDYNGYIKIVMLDVSGADTDDIYYVRPNSFFSYKKPVSTSYDRFRVEIPIKRKAPIDSSRDFVNIYAYCVYGDTEGEIVEQLKFRVLMGSAPSILNFNIYSIMDTSIHELKVGDLYVYDSGVVASFMHNPHEPNKLNKVINGGVAYYIRIKAPTSVINPTIILEIPSNGHSTPVPDYNYCYIRQFNRYYFITNMTILNNNIYEFSLSVDVLMSYKNKILEQTAFISTNQYIDKSRVFFNKRAVYGNRPITGYLASEESFDNVGNFSYIMTFSDYSPGSNTGGAAILDTYVMNKDALADIFNTIVKPNFWESWKEYFGGNPVEGIISIRAYPFDFDYLDTKDYEEKLISEIDIPWGTNLKINAGRVYRLSNIRSCIKNFNLTIPFYDVNDLPPYSKYAIFLPFVGWREFPDGFFADAVFRDSGGVPCAIRYYINLDTGTANIEMSSGGKGAVCLVESAPIGRNIPITENGSRERFQQYMSTAISAVSSGVSLGLGIASTFENVAINEALNTVASTASGLQTLATLPYEIVDKGKGIFENFLKPVTSNSQVKGTFNDILGGFENRRVKFYYEKPNLISVNAEYYGRPVYETHVLSELSGYTEVGAIHLEGFDGATSDELNSISAVLISGVIL